MINLETAVTYVRKRGDNIALARLEHILNSSETPQAVRGQLSAMQNSDGGFSYWLPGHSFSTVCDTAYILGWMDDLGLHEGELVNRAIEFIFRYQNEDGGWDEVGGHNAISLPEFLIPGNLKTRVWLTAYCAHWLMLFGLADSPQCRGCPVEFLRTHRLPSGKLIGYQRATWDALPVFARFPIPDQKPYAQALGVIKSEFTPENWAGSYLAWLLRGLRDSELPPGDSFLARCLTELAKKQRPDGSWDSEDGDKYAVSATIEALRIFKDFELI